MVELHVTDDQGEGQENGANAVGDPPSRQGRISGPGDALLQILGLLGASPLHRHLFIGDLDWLVVPPLMLRQFRIFRVEGRPAAYVSWAFLNEEAEARFTSGTPRLKPSEWNAGDRAWIVDVVMPFGNLPGVFEELKKGVFADRPVKVLQPHPSGKGSATVEL